jgi:putative tryptophan/tyrosine transport system substrate-binding protein
MPVVGFLNSSTPAAYDASIAAFRGGSAAAGYVEGHNVAIEYRMAEDHLDRLAALASDLVGRRVAVIATASSAPPALAAKAATQAIPIVFVMGSNPVELGVVSSLARPGGNVTGVTIIAGELFAKRLALLHELVPAATTVAYLVNLTNPSSSASVTAAQTAAANSLGVELMILNASSASDIDRAFATLIQRHAGALLVAPDTLFLAQRDQLVALSARHGIPTSYFRREAVEAGGLISYAADAIDAYRQAGIYVARILKGDRPADLPIVQPTKFELAINLKTAKALGLTVPETLLATADRVIE